MPTADEELAHVQLTGVLSKRPVNLTSQSSGIIASKWSKRFFVVKDGFLLYYPEKEQKEFERKRCANYRPRGVIALGDCIITKLQEQDFPYLISIINELSQDRLVVQCETSWEQEQWIEALEKAARICFRNVMLGDTLIQQLQVQGARLAEERQDACMTLCEERTRAEEMEQLMAAMEEEKERLEATSDHLQQELSKVSVELEATSSAMKEVENEKDHLVSQQSELSSLFSTLEKEKHETEKKLLETQARSVQLEEDNEQLSSKSEQARVELTEKISAEQDVKSELEQNLELIKNKMQQVLTDKELAEKKVEEQAALAKLLEDEKLLFHQEATELERNLNELKHQKDMTEVELKEEIKARLEAEQRLADAEAALKNLEQRINEVQTVASDEHRNQLMMNVKALKRYFEEKAIESKVDADKPMIMKRAVNNKRRNLRAKSMRLIRQDQEMVHMRVSKEMDEELQDSSTVKVRNSANNVLKNPSLRTMIAQSVHGDVPF
ncbi:pleckstrin homology domain-containing family D member 1-like [Watersipora subatra]|uniref:pleckstrin homology domain-containing family D member 1-like n=1 Tax=Watersipora subatra TaxID=2589382 RepID=UPI00355AD38E